MSLRQKLINVFRALNERELSPLQQGYQEFFKSELNQYGNEIGKDCNSPADLTDDECKEFFTRVKSKWPDKKSEIQSNLQEAKLRAFTRKVLGEATNTANASLDGANNSARYVAPGKRNHVNNIQLGGWSQVWEGDVADNPIPDDHRPAGTFTWVQTGTSAKFNNKLVRKGADLQIMSESIRHLVRKRIRSQIQKHI